jgi:hypothetical protein
MLDKAAHSGRAPTREHVDDCYDTPPCVVRALLKVEAIPRLVWEPACGTGNIVGVLRDVGCAVYATDLNDRGCPDSEVGVDFLRQRQHFLGSGRAIITNPPYALAEKFVAHALDRAPLVIMLLRLAFLESVRRSHILDGANAPARIHVFANRLPMMHRAGWNGRKASSAIAFAWFVWDRMHKGPTTIDRIRWEK